MSTPTPILLVIPEDLLTQACAWSSIVGPRTDEDEVEPRLALRCEHAQAEIALALVETGRPLNHLHVLRESLDRLASRRGYHDGAYTQAGIIRALARDPPRPRG